MLLHPNVVSQRLLPLVASLLISVVLATPAQAQNETTGAFFGTVSDSAGAPIAGAIVQVTYEVNGFQNARTTDQDGKFIIDLLGPGRYIIRVSKPGYKTQELLQTVTATEANSIIPIPVRLQQESPITTPVLTPVLQPSPTPTPPEPIEDIRVNINTTDGRRSGAFAVKEVVTLPLGGTTLVRSFDELALLLPGVAPPPQTLGGVAGPGVGSGVGSAGQFAVNGLRSRANNFTVDGSDNNDEDIGVRRQGFFSLIPQPIESIQQYSVITLLAPAQFGRNLGAQVNAISKSGTKETHGTIYGFFNSSQLNSLNFFDTENGNAVSPLLSGNQNVVVGNNFVFNGPVDAMGRCIPDPLGFCIGQFVPTDGRLLTVQNQSGGEDSSTLGQFGFVLGGPIKRGRMFYFLSAERQVLNATQEANFAVPTVAQRGLVGTGATGLFFNPFAFSPCSQQNLGACRRAYPTSGGGNQIFSLFPFPNNPNGIYRENTFTQVLPASARGTVLSGKIDGNFLIGGRQQTATARYNFTDDDRIIPVTGGAIFSTVRPDVRTQNFSFFLNSDVIDPNSTRPLFNQLRLSYGRTRLDFEEVRDQTFQLPSRLQGEPFLLNSPLLENFSLPFDFGLPNTNPVFYVARLVNGVPRTVEDALGPVGQVDIAGFSPLGVDVFNFPQQRINNTYQIADTLIMPRGDHHFAFGTDIRRSELNSDLPRNSRPLITFNGSPALGSDPQGNPFVFYVRPLDLVAAGAPTGFLQTLKQEGVSSAINLRFYQLNFFGQDEWRARRNLSLSYGLRYEYNTPPREVNRRIEDTFNSPLLACNDPLLGCVPGLRQFIDSRTEIFEPDRNNFAPRFGIAYSPNLFGLDRTTVVRAGFGIFYDQILGAVVSQSRNVFPNFLTLNTGGGPGVILGRPFSLFNPATTGLCFAFLPNGQCADFRRYVSPGTLNTLNPAVGVQELVSSFNRFFAGGFGATLPTRQLDTPTAHHYSVTFEQQLGTNIVISASYVGTQGRHLLRFTTPNFGQNLILVPLAFQQDALADRAASFFPSFSGAVFPPLLRSDSSVGAINIFETSANSRYDALQLQARGRFRNSLQYQLAYTFSKATDDVSDVFDLAGAPALPQNSITFEGERGPANFDARHRFSYNFIYDLPAFRDRSRLLRVFFGDLQVAGTGRFQTGQPFTVNSIFDVNLDGNLTDRLNTTDGIVRTGNRRQPLRLTVNPLTLLAPFGQDGQVGRNTFRAGNILELDMSVTKNFAINDKQNLTFRMDVFNFINRANFGIPVRILEFPSFGEATNTVTPGRRIQFALKYSF